LHLCERVGRAKLAGRAQIEKSHRDPVYGVQWLQSKTGTECASVSTDGQVLWWDIRKLGEPTMSMALEPKSSTGDGLLGGVSMDYSAAVCNPAWNTIRALAAARARRAFC
jgi:dynein intermediate chain 2